jgi:hypothetical protein
MGYIEQIYLSPGQIGAIYQRPYLEIFIDGVKLKLKYFFEKSGKLIKNKNTTYNSKFERETDLIIMDELTKMKYQGYVFEGGSEEDDLQITSGSSFNKI